MTYCTAFVDRSTQPVNFYLKTEINKPKTRTKLQKLEENYQKPKENLKKVEKTSKNSNKKYTFISMYNFPLFSRMI